MRAPLGSRPFRGTPVIGGWQGSSCALPARGVEGEDTHKHTHTPPSHPSLHGGRVPDQHIATCNTAMLLMYLMASVSARCLDAGHEGAEETRVCACVALRAVHLCACIRSCLLGDVLFVHCVARTCMLRQREQTRPGINACVHIHRLMCSGALAQMLNGVWSAACMCAA